MKRSQTIVFLALALMAGCSSINGRDVTGVDVYDRDERQDDGLAGDIFQDDVDAAQDTAPDDAQHPDQAPYDAGDDGTDRDATDDAADATPDDADADIPAQDGHEDLPGDVPDVWDPCGACPQSICDPETLECLECTQDSHCGLTAWCDTGTCRDHLCNPGADFCHETTLYKCSVNGGGFTIIRDCADNDPCTIGDGCVDGRCVAGTVVDCSDDNQCTVDYCGVGGVCDNYQAEGIACNDGNPCTVDDRCSSGRCLPGKTISCTDNNPCTLDYCAQLVGCIHEPSSGDCTDTSGCTWNDRCIEGRCSGSPAECDDGDQCTSDYCYSGSCRHDRINGCVPCSVDTDCPSPGGCRIGYCDQGSCRVRISSDDGCCVDISDCPETPPCVRSFCDDNHRCGTGALAGIDCCFRDTWSESFDNAIPEDWVINNITPTVGWRAGNLNGNVPGISGTAIYFGNETETSYDDGAVVSGSFTTGTIRLPANSALNLSFNLWQDVDTTGGYDELKVFINASTQAGLKTALLWDESAQVPASETTTIAIDLSGYAGRDVSITFLFDTYDGVSNSGRGVYIDDLAVDATCTALGCLADAHCKSSGINGFCRDSRCDFSSSWMQIGSFGQPGSSAGQFLSPTDLISMAGPEGVGNQILVADSRTHYIQVFDQDGTFVRMLGGYGVIDGKFLTPRGMAASESRVFVADSSNGRIQAITPAGVYLYKFGSAGIDPGQFDTPRDVAVSPDGDLVYVADTGNHRISVFSRLGAYRYSFGGFGRTDGRFRTPSAVAVTRDGRVWVCDTQNNRIQVFTGNGVLQNVIAPTGVAALWYPGGIAALPDGGVVVADTYNHRLVLLDSEGVVTDILGRFGTGSDEFTYPSDVDVMNAGSEYRLVVADAGNYRITTWAIRRW